MQTFFFVFLAACGWGVHKHIDSEGTFPFDCADGYDNDENGLVDCDDPSCKDTADCVEDSGAPEDTASVEGETN